MTRRSGFGTRWAQLPGIQPSAFILQPSKGQSLAIVAIILPFLAALLLTAIELGERAVQRALIEDALSQATRSAVQSFDYAAFAANDGRISAEPNTAYNGCAGAPQHSARAVGCRVLISNLGSVRGLEETPEQLAAQVSWSIHPAGGTCTFPGGRPPVSATTPLVCATLQPRLAGLLGWGVWMPEIDAAETLDTAQD
jgi:hypothetical protein